MIHNSEGKRWFKLDKDVLVTHCVLRKDGESVEVIGKRILVTDWYFTVDDICWAPRARFELPPKKRLFLATWNLMTSREQEQHFISLLLDSPKDHFWNFIIIKIKSLSHLECLETHHSNINWEY